MDFDPGLTVPAVDEPATAVHVAVASALADATSSADAAHRVAVAVGATLRWPLVEVWLVDDDRDVLSCIARHASGGRDFTVFTVAELDFGVGLPGRAFRAEETTWVADLAAVLSPTARDGLASAVAVPLRAADGTVVGVLAGYRDHTGEPRDALLYQLQSIADRVGGHLHRRRGEEATAARTQSRSDHLTMAAHELRDFLAIIAAAAELHPHDDPELLRANLRTIRHVTHRLIALTDDLLDLEHQQRTGATPVNLTEIITQSAGAVAATALAKDLAITLDLPPRLPVYADAAQLRQVADNLLIDALQHTAPGGAVTVLAASCGEHLTWLVTDTSIGIPAAEDLDRHHAGAALKPVVTRAIVERHGGTLHVVDHAAEPGTTVLVRLPLARDC